MPDWSTAEWTSVLATLFAALATLAALGATFLQLIVMRRARLPHLVGAVRGYPNGTAQVVVANAGPGLAVQVGYLMVDGDYLATGLIGGGFLQPGEEGASKFVRPPSPDVSIPAVFVCRDVDNRLHIWAHRGGYRCIPTRRVLKRKDIDIRDHFRRFYPDVPIPSGSATSAEGD